MKKILVLGAAGCIGLNVIKYLLIEGKYEITAVDLKNKKVYKRIKKYRKRINIIYGDILDRSLIEALVKDHDYVINLASCMPPLAEYKKDLANIIEYQATENIVRAINYYNPKCHLIYASSTSIYEDLEKVSVDTKLNDDSFSYFNIAKIDSEKLITKKAKNYTIVRVPLVLGDLRKDNFMYHIKKNSTIECITKEDCAYAFSRCISNSDEINKKIINIGGGKTCQCTCNELLINILKFHGLSSRYILSTLFMSKNYTSPVLLDSDKSEKTLKYRNDSLDSFFMRQKRRSRGRKLEQLCAKPFIWLIKRKKKNI